jgi:hypothetical protein
VTQTLISSDVEAVLRLQGIATETHVGLLEASSIRPIVQRISGDAKILELKSVEEAVRAARSSHHYVFLVGAKSVLPLIEGLGSDASAMGAIIAVGPDGPSAATLRSAGAMAVVPEPTDDALRPLVRRGLEYRALRALELAHRCEARRLLRRHMELLGHPPETMTDDLNTFQPPPLPVGPISTYNLEEVSEAFERAYIDRVQHLCASAREAAQYLDVSAATLARRLRKEGGVVSGAQG